MKKISYNFLTAHRSCLPQICVVKLVKVSILSLIRIAVKIVVDVITLDCINKIDAVFCMGGNNLFD